MKKAYTLKRNKNTDEIHLFEGDFSVFPCTSEKTSICKRMNKSEQMDKNIFQCLDEDLARFKCAEIGRTVCGTCVSHLYTSYN